MTLLYHRRFCGSISRSQFRDMENISGKISISSTSGKRDT